MKKLNRASAAGVLAAVILGISLMGNAVQYVRGKALRDHLLTQRRREMADIADAMSDIEINLQKLVLTTGAAQSVPLLSDTALLAQMVESSIARLPLEVSEAENAIKFAGQMGDYTLSLAAQVSGGGMLTGEDEERLSSLLDACRTLNAYLGENGEALYAMTGENVERLLPPSSGESAAIAYPTLIYDGPFSDGRSSGVPKGLTGERITREQARQVAARAAGTTADQVQDAADSGGAFEAFGFSANTQNGLVNVQITGAGGHVLWMMPERAEFAQNRSREECVSAARIWLADLGFGEMEPCFTQEYDGMVTANFAAVQDGVLLYPDQVKVQVSMETGSVVGAECTQYLRMHTPREDLIPTLTIEAAKDMVSSKLEVSDVRLCVIPKDEEERLCWGFEGEHEGSRYFVFIDAKTGEAADILRVMETEQGEMAL